MSVVFYIKHRINDVSITSEWSFVKLMIRKFYGQEYPKKVENETQQVDLEVGRGEIHDNALKAIVTSRLFKTRTERAKKGRGSFNRKMKHKGKEPYSKEAQSCFF